MKIEAYREVNRDGDTVREGYVFILGDDDDLNKFYDVTVEQAQETGNTVREIAQELARRFPIPDAERETRWDNLMNEERTVVAIVDLNNL